MTSRRNILLAGATLAAAPVVPRAAEQTGGSIVADEFWADKNGVRLWVYRKRLQGSTPKMRLFCVHGSSYSGKTMFDLQVPGRDYSMMDWFARRGYEVWTMDHEGLRALAAHRRQFRHPERRRGPQGRDGRGREGLRHREASAFFGSRRGALRAGALRRSSIPSTEDKLALDAFVWTGKGRPRSLERAKRGPMAREQHKRPVDAEFYRAVFTRDHSGAAEPMLGEVIAARKSCATATRCRRDVLDMVTKLPLVGSREGASARCSSCAPSTTASRPTRTSHAFYFEAAEPGQAARQDRRPPRTPRSRHQTRALPAPLHAFLTMPGAWTSRASASN
jgi:hypothetical protein